MKHKLRGIKHKIKFQKPKLFKKAIAEIIYKKKLIRISPKLKGKLKLEAIIHEALHGCVYDLKEEAVFETAKDIAKLLWRLGYRSKR